MTENIEFHLIPAKQINADLFIDRAQFEHAFEWHDQLSENQYTLYAIRDKNIVAIAKIYIKPNASNIHIDFLEVAKNARGTHLSRAIIGELYKKAASLDKTITVDGFTQQGKILLGIFRDFQKQYGEDSFSEINRF